MMNQLAKINETGIEISNTADLAVAVQMIVSSDLCPQQYRAKPKDAMIAILSGRQVGWGPMQSLQYIAVINGRPSMYGDGPTGLAYGSGKVEWVNEWWECGGERCEEPNFARLEDYPADFTSCWQTKRKDASEPSKVSRFSVGDAKVANLWGKKGPWVAYPKRMLTCRSRAWGLRDNYSDALQGISQAEEWADMKPTHEPDPLESGKLLKVIDATPIEKPGADQLDRFRDRVAKKRPGCEMADDAFVAAICVRECSQPTLESLTKDQFDSLGKALAAGKYDWQTGGLAKSDGPDPDDESTWPIDEDTGDRIPPSVWHNSEEGGLA